MIAGFVKVDRHTFYTKIWPKIKSNVDAVQSNRKEFNRGEVPTLIIHWGYKNLDTGETVVVAVSESERDQIDEHSVMPSLLKT